MSDSKMSSGTGGKEKKLINEVKECIKDMYSGFQKTFPGLLYSTNHCIIMHNQDENSAHIGIVSGGGSGHEPFAAGFVGKGMLTAAVPGNVFASPPATQCFSAIQNVAQLMKGGILVLALNYTGDLLNFGLACESARDIGYKVELVAVGEDCALFKHKDKKTTVGRRGLVGMLFVIKIAGAMAVKGLNLDTIKSTCNDVVQHMATFGVCTSPCILPGAESPLFTISPSKVQFGVGIHGEAGVDVVELFSASHIVDVILQKLKYTLKLNAGDKVSIIVNNLGATTLIECYIIAGELHKQLDELSITVERMYVGSLCTSLDMGGIQLSILQVNDHPDWLQYLDAPTEASAWPGRVHSYESKSKAKFVEYEAKIEVTGPEISEFEAVLMKRITISIAQKLKENEKHINQLDAGCGDGDCGSTLSCFADALLANIDKLNYTRPRTFFLQLSNIASESMGGTAGGIYSLLFRGASRAAPDWKKCVKSALDTVNHYTPARKGDRTMMDALIPFYEELEKTPTITNWKTVIPGAVNKAVEGCTATANMTPVLGRATYVSDIYLKDVDAGAFGVTVWLKVISEEVEKIK